MKEIEIGMIVTAVGIKGEVKFYSFSDDPMKLSELEYIYVGKNKTRYDVEKVRSPKGNTAALKLVCRFYAATLAWRSFASAFWCASTPSARRRF